MVTGMGPSMNVPCISLQVINISLDNKKKKKSFEVKTPRGKKWQIKLIKHNTYSLSSLLQFPIKPGIFPDIAVPSILLQAVSQV